MTVENIPLLTRVSFNTVLSLSDKFYVNRGEESINLSGPMV